MIQYSKEEKEMARKARAEYNKNKQEHNLSDTTFGTQEEPKPVLTGLMEGEDILSDDYPVYGNHLYVLDDGETQKVIMCDLFQGTVRHMKSQLFSRGIQVKYIRRCNLKLRNLL